jgi:hypothetical protein
LKGRVDGQRTWMTANALEGMMKAFRLVLHGSLRGIIFDRRRKWAALNITPYKFSLLTKGQ